MCLTLLRSPVASGKLSKWCSATSLCSFGSLPPINAHYVSLRKTDLNFYKKEKKRDRCQAHITKLDLRLWYFQFSIYYKWFKVLHVTTQYNIKQNRKWSTCWNAIKSIRNFWLCGCFLGVLEVDLGITWTPGKRVKGFLLLMKLMVCFFTYPVSSNTSASGIQKSLIIVKSWIPCPSPASTPWKYGWLAKAFFLDKICVSFPIF